MNDKKLADKEHELKMAKDEKKNIKLTDEIRQLKDKL